MRKGPLIAAGICYVIGLIMIILGIVLFTDVGAWPDWFFWFGIVIFNIGLIVMVVAFIKKPGEAEEKALKVKETPNV